MIDFTVVFVSFICLSSLRLTAAQAIRVTIASFFFCTVTRMILIFMIVYEITLSQLKCSISDNPRFFAAMTRFSQKKNVTLFWIDLGHFSYICWHFTMFHLSQIVTRSMGYEHDINSHIIHSKMIMRMQILHFVLAVKS